MFADTHCHLNFSNFQEDLAKTLERAWECGVNRILIPGTDLETSQQAIGLSERFPGLYAAVGIHPNEGATWTADTIQQLRILARHPKVRAIGEIGLDYYRDRLTRSKQKEILKKQLELAAEMNLPVVLHNREAITDLWPILSDWKNYLHHVDSQLSCNPGVLHSFDGSHEDAMSAIDEGFKIGIGGPVTYKNAQAQQQLVMKLPLSSVILETDAPFLAPHPRRGQRNEPANVLIIAQKIASLQGIPVETVAQATSKNAGQLFRW